MRYVRVSIAGMIAALVVAVPAFAGGSTLLGGYAHTPNNVAGTVAVKVTKTSAPKVIKASPTVKSTGTLPFTGTDLGTFAVAALALAGLGLVFRRLGRQSN
jgi:hypothetical protein